MVVVQIVDISKLPKVEFEVKALMLPEDMTVQEFADALLSKAREIHAKTVTRMIRAITASAGKVYFSFSKLIFETQLEYAIFRRVPFRFEFTVTAHRLGNNLYIVEVKDDIDLLCDELGCGVSRLVMTDGDFTLEHAKKLLKEDIARVLEKILTETVGYYDTRIKLVLEGEEEYNMLMQIFELVLSDFVEYEQFSRTVRVW